MKLWEVNGNTASSSSSYVAGTLYKTITTDENWKPAKLREGSVEEFKDKDGHIVLKRIWENNGKSLDTYYVYDDMSNLRYVLPPAVNPNGQSPLSSVNEGSTEFTGFIYGYHYDNKRRLTEKHVPGKGWEYLVYNNADQVVLSQDSRQHALGKWMYTKYNILGRVTSTGIYTNRGSNVSLQGIVNTETNLYESRAVNADYSNVAFPRDNVEVQSINYYDDYTFPGGNTFTASASGVMQGQTKGLQTGSKVTVLGTTATMLLSVNYYDKDARLRQAFKQHYQGGSLSADKYDEVINSWSFTGELEGTERNHHNGAAITQITTTTIYDHMGRKVKSFEKIGNDNEVQLAGLTYNEVGQLLNKSLHSENDGASFLQSSGYAYNERGWMKGMNSAQFSFALDYADGTAAQFNGNIANQRWGAGNSLPNTFTYTYDALNRLTAGSAPGMSEQIGYDEMGNIRSMNRDGAIGTYNYTGNKLNSISAGALATGSYVYDENGNATTDGRTGVTLSYNVLNLPDTATKSGLSMSYVYSADGAKLRKESNITGNRDYVDGIEYNGSEIDIIHTEEGIARRNGSSYAYEYNLTDHLGNVRYTFNKHPTTGALQRLQGDDYYAFGLRKSNSPVSQNNKYLYNGKELQDELGQYDYGARFYDPVIGRWNVVDPLSEGMRKFSPYVYCGNNPIRFVDPDGMFFNEYVVVIQGGKVQSTTMTGTKGGDVTDYVKVVNLDAAPYSSGITNYTLDVQTGYTSGVAADEGEGSQKRHPSPGIRQKHGGMPTDIRAYFWLTTGLSGRAAAILDGAGAFAANGVLKP